MTAPLTRKHLLRLTDLSSSQIIAIATQAGELSNTCKKRETVQALKGRRIGLIVDDSGWRNTTAFDLGMKELGATCTSIPITLSGEEDISDLAKYVSNWFDLVAIRTRSLEKLEAFAAAASVPVLNLRTRTNHPCEILGDLAYILKRRGTLKDLNIVAISPAANIIHSWAEAAIALPLGHVPSRGVGCIGLSPLVLQRWMRARTSGERPMQPTPRDGT